MWIGNLFVRQSDHWFEERYHRVWNAIKEGKQTGRVEKGKYMQCVVDIDDMLGKCLEGKDKDPIECLLKRVAVGVEEACKEGTPLDQCVSMENMCKAASKVLFRLETNTTNMLEKCLVKKVEASKSWLLANALATLSDHRTAASPETQFEDLITTSRLMLETHQEQLFYNTLKHGTATFYRSKAALLACEGLSVEEYSMAVSELLSQERSLISQIVPDVKWREALTKASELELLKTYKEALLIQAMSALRRGDWEHFTVMHSLLFRVDPAAVDDLSPAVTKIVTDEGLKYLKEHNGGAIDQGYVHFLMELHSKYKENIAASPLEDSRDVIEEGRVKGMVELLTKTSDDQAKLCEVLLHEAEVGIGLGDSESVKKTVEILAYLKERNVFYTGYRKALCKRLLACKDQQQPWEVTEGTYLDLFDPVMGGTRLGTKSREMIADKKASIQIVESFRDQPTSTPFTWFSPLVLTGPSWPLLKTDDMLVLPTQMGAALTAFTDFFTPSPGGGRPGKLLRWVHSIGRVAMVDTTTNAKLSMGTYQAVVVMTLGEEDNEEGKTVPQIVEPTGMPADVVASVLVSLSPLVSPVVGTDKYVYTAPKGDDGVNLSSTPLQYTATSPVATARRSAILSTLLKFVKRSKTIRVPTLLSETSASLRPTYGVLKVDLLTKGVKALITMGFVERGTSDRQLLVYVMRDAPAGK
eukprot:TRINITY_DN1366_c2_g2_i1.p1 TRINITY_DN1366_c2_g2~~TRINITY_DN1366_c2_g2_i1.p1  ORF type:complete len:704 (+),score=142.17 TRINITY_DN1366_c2_g2_i1:23-2113(+)